jgi:hypothetical protein
LKWIFGSQGLTQGAIVCYNRPAGHGQMLRVAGLPVKDSTAQLPVGFLSINLGIGNMGWKRLTLATWLALRKDSKIKGFQLTR